jgi:two-component system chemotaxis response regulator CheB
MSGRDIICIGASAGGVDALMKLAPMLAPDLPAALFVIQHVPASQSLLPEILSRAGPLPAGHPSDGDPIEYGTIYVAPPDNHLLIEHGHVRIVRGPKENGFRPAIDATFRTAARAYGPRAVGVVLTGMLDDGTAGLLAIKRRGGVAVAQNPAEAAYPSMPATAIQYVTMDAVVSLDELPQLFVRLASKAVNDQKGEAMPDRIDLEAGISEMQRDALDHAEEFGSPAPFSCPDCGGVLVEYYDGDLLRFRCQVGHAYSRDSLFACQTEMLDWQLWAAYRALDERATLAKRLVTDARRLNDRQSERRFAQLSAEAEAEKGQIREALLRED